MARGRKTGGRDFKPGQSGNPNGKPKMSPEFKALKCLTASEYNKLVSSAFTLKDNEIQSLLDDPNISSLHKAFAHAVLIGRMTGDLNRLNYITDRVFGKVKEKIEVKQVKPTVLEKRDGTQLVFTNEPVEDDEED